MYYGKLLMKVHEGACVSYRVPDWELFQILAGLKNRLTQDMMYEGTYSDPLCLNVFAPDLKERVLNCPVVDISVANPEVDIEVSTI